MVKLRKNKGITLVALVVTIIILLILAGVTISQLTGSGLFNKIQLAKEKWANAQEKENAILGQYENAVNGRFDEIIDTIVDGGRDIDENELRNLITEAVQEKVTEQLAGYAKTTDLSSYATTSSITEILANYATKQYVDDSIPSSSLPGWTKHMMNTNGYVTGSTEITLPSSYTELYIKVKVRYNIK